MKILTAGTPAAVRRHSCLAKITIALITVVTLASIAVVTGGSTASAKTQPPGFLWHIQNKTGSAITNPNFTIAGYDANGRQVETRSFKIGDSSNDWFDPNTVKSVSIFLDSKQYDTGFNGENRCYRFYNNSSNIPHVGLVINYRLALATTGTKCNTKL